MENHAEIEQEFINHFQEVLHEPQIDKRLVIEKITQNVPKVITEEHNQLLL